MRNLRAALAAAIALAFPAAATVTGNPPPAAYSCNGTTTTYTIPFPYLATSNVVATVTTATVPTTLALGTDYTVTPSTAPSVGTLKLTAGSKCPNGSTLTLTRNTPLTQPQSFRQGAYNGPATEQAFDRIEMQLQQGALKEQTDLGVVNNTVAAFNSSGAAIGSTTSVLATGSTTPRTLAARAADVVNVKDYGAKGDWNGATGNDDTAAIQAAINAASRTPGLTTDNNLGDSGVTVFFPAGVYRVTSTLTVQHDGVSLMGEGPAASVLAPVANASTDTIAYGPVSGTQSGRRSTISELGINNATTSTSRDAISITDTSYWRIKHVVIFQPGRYGVAIKGTLDGRADDVRVNSAGDSGIFIDKSPSSGTGETTTLWTRLYTGNNQKHGALVRRGSHVTFIDSIFEFNGLGGVAGDGIKIGDQTADGQSNIKLYAPYFEGNNGWDIYCGDVNSASFGGRVFVYGETATNVMTSKIGSSLHARLDYCVGSFYGGYVNYVGQPAGLFQFNQYATDPRGGGGSFLSTILGITGVSSAALPSYLLDGVATDLNKFSGKVEWTDPSNNLVTYGKYPLRVGGPGAGSPSVQFTRDTAIPTSGTYAVGDLAFNAAANINGGNRVLMFRNIAAGTPGTWEQVWGRPWKAGRVAVTYTSGVAMALDATLGDWFSLNVTDGVAYTFTAPTGGVTGQPMVVTIKATAAINVGDPFPAAMKHSAWTAPANGFSRSITFRYDGTNWTQVSQTGVDIPN